LIVMLTLAVFSAKLPVAAQRMNQKDSPSAGVIGTVDHLSVFAEARDVEDRSAERDLYDGGTEASPALLGMLGGNEASTEEELAVTYAVKLK